MNKYNYLSNSSFLSKIDRLKSNKEDHIKNIYEKYEITLEKAIEMKDDNLEIDKRHLEEIRKEIRNLGNVNLDSIKEYEQIKKQLGKTAFEIVAHDGTRVFLKFKIVEIVNNILK